MKSANSSRSYFSLCCSEPFRLFFPLGTLIGISGVSLWPLFFTGIHTSFYPGVMHARMMIEGFLGAYVIGFLGTAMPRLLGGRHFRGWEIIVLLALHLLQTGLHIGHRWADGDLVFLFESATLVVFLARRWPARKDLPPPSFALVLIGFIQGIAGAAILRATWASSEMLTTARFGLGMLHEGWLLAHVVGISAFLLPRFFGAAKPPLPEMRTPTPEWWRGAAIAAVTGLAIIASYAIEAYAGAPRLAGLVRLVAAGGYLVYGLPWRGVAWRPTLAIGARGSLLLLMAGLLFPMAWPFQRVAGLHVVFIGGFTMLAFTVATRVVLGHSGNAQYFTRQIPPLAAALGLLIAGMILRVAGDFVPLHRGPWLNYASYAWMLGAMIWGGWLFPKVRIADPEE